MTETVPLLAIPRSSTNVGVPAEGALRLLGVLLFLAGRRPPQFVTNRRSPCGARARPNGATPTSTVETTAGTLRSMRATALRPFRATYRYVPEASRARPAGI